MRYAPDKCRIGRTPSYWDSFENNYRKRALIIGKTPAPDYQVAYPDALGGDLPAADPDVPKFMKRNQRFGIPIFGREMRFNMETWKEGYRRAFSVFTLDADYTDAAGTLHKAGEDVIPFYPRTPVLEYNWNPHAVTGAVQEPLPEQDDYEPRFGLHCRKSWFETVGVWINSLQCVRAYFDFFTGVSSHLNRLYSANGFDGTLNNGQSPMYSRGPGKDEQHTAYDVDGSQWHYDEDTEFTSGGLIYASDWPYTVNSGDGITQRGQCSSDGSYWQQCGAIVQPSAFTLYVLGFPNSFLLTNTRYEMKEGAEADVTGGKVFGFSFGRKYHYTEGPPYAIESPGFDGINAYLDVDGDRVSLKVGQSSNVPNTTPPGYIGIPFLKDMSLESVKKQYDVLLSSDAFSVPGEGLNEALLSDPNHGLGGWDGGVTLMYAVFSLDVAAKLEPLD
jgi:hypothetical protein